MSLRVAARKHAAATNADFIALAEVAEPVLRAAPFNLTDSEHIFDLIKAVATASPSLPSDVATAVALGKGQGRGVTNAVKTALEILKGLRPEDFATYTKSHAYRLHCAVFPNCDHASARQSLDWTTDSGARRTAADFVRRLKAAGKPIPAADPNDPPTLFSKAEIPLVLPPQRFLSGRGSIAGTPKK